MPVHIAVLLALTAGLFDKVPRDQMTDAEQAVHTAAADIPAELSTVYVCAAAYRFQCSRCLPSFGWMPVKAQLFIVSKCDKNIVTGDRQAKGLVEEAKGKAKRAGRRVACEQRANCQDF